MSPIRTSDMPLTHLLVYVAGIFILTAIGMLAFTWNAENAGRYTIGAAAFASALTLLYLIGRKDPELATRRRQAALLLSAGTLSLSLFVPSIAGKLSINLPAFAFDGYLAELSTSTQVIIGIIAAVCYASSAWLLKPVSNVHNIVILDESWAAEVKKASYTLSRRNRVDSPSGMDTEQQIAAIAISNPHLLAQRYVIPNYQIFNPADYNEANPLVRKSRPVHELLGDFLKKQFVDKDGTHILFILSDAGMGKSSLLIMLKLTGVSKKIWPKDVHIDLFKLGPDTLDKVSAVERKSNTVLLLDALDEDPCAYGDVETRLANILAATREFRQVILSSRTYFFPANSRNPMDHKGWVRVSGYNCNLIYLSPFSDSQVEEYLRKSFARPFLARVFSHKARQSHAKLPRAISIAKQMQSLRMRPMLLAHIDRLLEAEVVHWTEWTVYDALVNRWLDREHREKGAEEPKKTRVACEALASELQRRQTRELPDADFRTLAETTSVEVLSRLDRGGISLLNQTSDYKWRFSHYTVQEFLFCSALLSQKQVIQKGLQPQVTDQITRFFRAFGSVEISASTISNVRKYNNVNTLLAALPDERFWGLSSRAPHFAAVDLVATLTEPQDSPVLRLFVIAEYRKRVADAIQRLGMRKIQKDQAMPRAIIVSIDHNLRYADLQGLPLQYVGMPDFQLQEANLSYADLRGADLQRTNLKGANLNGADLREACLQQADLRGADLRGADLRGALLQKANLEGALLGGVSHRLSNPYLLLLRHAALELGGFADTIKQHFRKNRSAQAVSLAELKEQVLASSLVDVRIEITSNRNLKENPYLTQFLAGTSAAKFRKANFSGAILRNVSLDKEDLSRVDLSRADLSGSNLSEVDLSKADLSNANLSRSRLSNLYMTDTTLANADISGVMAPSSLLDELRSKGARVHIANVID